MSTGIRTRACTGSPTSGCATAEKAAGRSASQEVDRPRSGTASARDRDGRLAGGDALRLHLLGEPHGLFDEGLHDLGLGDGLDDLALDEELPLAVAGVDTEIRLTGLSGTVDATAHHGHAQRNLHARQARGDLLGQLVHVHLRTTARRARDDLQPTLL